MRLFEAMELSLIKMALSACAKAKGEQIREKLEEIGIEVEVTFDVDVKAVDLDTLHANLADDD